ncbi:MAG: radical SAM protein [Aquificota bacterium]|nr:radical SAM protein [Aquificota bacterium]
MDREKKINLLSRLALFECERSPNLDRCIYDAKTQRGRVPILKVLQSTYCDRNCDYCVFRRDREKTPRVYIDPEDLAKGFWELYTKGRVKGIFLSSGIFIHPEVTMEKMIDTVKILRDRYGYRGYVHLKIMPGVSVQTVEEAVKVADRVSINIEAPTEKRLKAIAKGKSLLGDIIPKMKEVAKILESFPAKDQTTQVIVGAGGETDREILKTSEFLYREIGVKRVYYSPFRPVDGTPMENLPPCPEARGRALYRADFLIRDYGFTAEEILGGKDFLELGKDPKETWAERNQDLFPVEINRADFETLIRIPGVGKRTAEEIIRRRLRSAIRKPGGP